MIGDKKEAAVLTHNEPQGNNLDSILSSIKDSVKENELKNAMTEKGLNPKSVIFIVRKLFPSFDKSMLSKCLKPEKYGVVIHPLALALLRTDKQSPVLEPIHAHEGHPNQLTRVLRHLSDYGSITPLEALNEYGIMRLASRISELRKAGYDIDSDTVTDRNRYGEKCSYSRYFFRRKENKK